MLNVFKRVETEELANILNIPIAKMRKSNNNFFVTSDPWQDPLDQTIPFSVIVVLCISTTIFISYGVFLLVAVKGRRRSTSNMVAYTNTTLLIMMSTCGLGYSMIRLIDIVLKSWFSKQKVLIQINVYFCWVDTSFYFSTIYLITLNRLLSTVYPIWYATSMTKKIFFIKTVVVCTVVTVLNVTGLVNFFSKTNSKFGAGLLTILYTNYLIFSIFSYTVIFRTILKRRQHAQTAATVGTNRILLSFICRKIKEEGYTIPFVITATYALFVIVPGITIDVFMFMDKTAHVTVTCSFWNVTFILNTFADACIYVFCDRDIRLHLKRRLKRNDMSESGLRMQGLRDGIRRARTTTTEV